MATPSACLSSPTDLPQSSRPPSYPLTNPPHSHHSTPRSRRRSIHGLTRGAPPCLCCGLPMHRGPVPCAPLLPLSSPARSFSSLSLPPRAAVSKRPRSVFPLLLFYPLRPCGPLRPLDPSLTLLPPALAVDIARTDKDVGNQTGGVVALISVAGGSARRGKIPSRPRAIVGDGISRPLLLHLPHQ